LVDLSEFKPSNSLTEFDADVTVAPQTSVHQPIEPVGAGESVGPYQLVRWLGSGGMGNVWEAIETNTGRRVALKRLAKSMVSDETYVKRFVREAQLAAQISHPKVTFIYGAGNHQGQPYIAMELMPGKTLADKVEEEGPIVYPVAVDGIIDVVDGLIAAHDLGMIHRDIKPSNCFLDTDESVKIGDFGLSKSLVSTEVNLTQTGTFMGTPSYAAPEQIRGGDLDGRTDIYSIGATLYFLLTGKTPFRGDAMSVTAQIISDKAPSCSGINHAIPRDLDSVIAKCLEKEPNRRFQSLEELKLALIPFATQREAIADIGRRLAAFMVDQTMIQIVFTTGFFLWSIISVITSQVGQGLTPEEASQNVHEGGMVVMFWGNIICWGFTLLYYAICEGRFGRALGKRLMGLKVVNKEGQSVGFWRALLRACIIPGSVGIPFLFSLWQSLYGSLPVTVEENVFQIIRGTALAFVPSMIFISTMRTSNRLWGIHGMLSGTRVIRVSSTQKMNIPVVKPRPVAIETQSFGPYQTNSMMGESELGKVYLGHDKPLNRDVWIVVRENGTEPCSERINLARVSRQRWLEGGINEGLRWDAYEAIHGVPIQTFVGIKNNADWTLYGQVMLDLVEELESSLEDGTLPQSLSLPQVWLDKDGHAKLLDKKLVSAVSAVGTDSSHDEILAKHEQSDPIEDSVGLIQELGDLYCRTKTLPSSVQDFIGDLVKRPKKKETLGWAEDQLKLLSKTPSEPTWDSRLGLLSATVGIEFVFYSLTATLLILTCYFVIPIPHSYRFIVGTAAGLLVPIGLSIWSKGGPIFRVMNFQVCNLRGRPAHWMTVAVRAAISWLPAIVILACFLMLMLIAESQTTHIKPETGSLGEYLENSKVILVGLIVFFAAAISLSIGMLFSILSPKRGLIDYLLGTCLLPR